MALTYPEIVLTLADESTLTFRDTGVISAEIVEESNPISATLPISDLNCKLFDDNGGFSVFGTENTFAARKPIEVYEYINGTKYYIGKYYLNKPTVIDQKQIEIEAVDAIGLLDTTDFDGRFWSSLTDFSVIVDAILGDLSIEYEIESVLQGQQLKGWIPPGNRRDALQQACFAVGAAVKTSRTDEIVIYESPLPETHDWHHYDIGVNDKFRDQPISLKPLVTSIELVAHNYEQSATEETIFDDTLEAGTYKIIFEKPYYDVSISGVGYVPTYLGTTGGDTLVNEDDEKIVAFGEFEFGPNSVTLNVVEPGGAVLIKGYPWNDIKQAYTFTESGLASDINKNVLNITNATLVSNDNANTVLNRIRDYYRQRYLHEFILVPAAGTKYGVAVYGVDVYGWSSEAVNIGQILSVDTVHGEKIRCAIERITLNLTGGFLGKYETTGVEVVS